MERILLRRLAAATAAAALSASGFTITAAAQSDQQPTAAEQPTHAEQVQHWAEVGIDNQLKGLKTSLRLTADQEKDWGPFESAVKDAETARVLALQKEQATNLSPMDHNTAKAERLEQSPSKSREDRRSGQALVREPRWRPETQVHRAWTHARA